VTDEKAAETLLDVLAHEVIGFFIPRDPERAVAEMVEDLDEMAQTVLADAADYSPRNVLSAFRDGFSIEAARVWRGLNRTEKRAAAEKAVAAWREADADEAMWRQS